MSNALQTDTLLDAIRGCIQTAMGWDVSIPISYEIPRTPLPAPYAAITPVSVDNSIGGRFAGIANGTTQENRFHILIRKPYPADGEIIAIAKISDANAIIAELQGASTFAGVGIQPIVSSVVYAESDDPGQGVYELELVFDVATVGTHH